MSRKVVLGGFLVLLCCMAQAPLLAEGVPGGWGAIRNVGEGQDAITLIEVGGDRYQMGYWYGRLLANQIASAWEGFMADVKVPDEVFDQALQALWNEQWFDTASWERELHGIADGCADAGHAAMDFQTMRRFMAVADISENGCSLFCAWGKATANGDVYQMRNLDWSMTTGLQRFPVVAVYHPVDGRVHAVVGFAGMAGAAVGGMNDAGLAVSEIMGYFGDAETLEGMPFPVLLREVLYRDQTLGQALSRIGGAVRTNQYHYAVADPAALGAKGRLLFTSHTRCDGFTDASYCTKHPIENPTPYYEPLEGVVYWKNHNGSGNKVLHDALAARYGAIDGSKAIEIARAAGVDGTLVSILYGNTRREFWVAFAEGTEPAHQRAYVHFDFADFR